MRLRPGRSTLMAKRPPPSPSAPVNVMKRNGLLPKHFGGPPAHKASVRRARELELISDRQQKAWDLFTAGATFLQVGAALGVSGKTAWTDVMRVKDSLPLVLRRDAELLRQRAMARLDTLTRTHWPTKGRKDSADILLRTWKREAELCGLDAPVKITATDASGTRPYQSLSEDELSAEVMRLRGLLSDGTIDVAPSRDGDETRRGQTAKD